MNVQSSVAGAGVKLEVTLPCAAKPRTSFLSIRWGLRELGWSRLTVKVAWDLHVSVTGQ